MLGLLLVTHAPLGGAFLQAVQHVYHFMPECLEAIDVVADQDLGQVQDLVKQAIHRLNSGSGVLIMTDVMGGTPSNCCGKVHEAVPVAIISGVNLPMLLRAISYREKELNVVAEMAIAGGQLGAMRIDVCD
jgi:PTS system ascorbate-specific IIA component